LWPGLRPGPRCGSLQCSPAPLLDLRGLLLSEGEGNPLITILGEGGGARERV